MKNEKSPSEYFGESFKELRLSLGLSQLDVSLKAGLKGNGYIAKLEKGTNLPEDHTLVLLARGLGVEPEVLFAMKKRAQLRSLGSIQIPVLGMASCGNFKESIEVTDEFIPIMADDRLARKKDIFALKAEGDSMINAGIHDGDIVIIDPHRTPVNGNIVVACVDDKVTLKHFYLRGGYVILEPANENYPPIRVDDPSLKIYGVLIEKFIRQQFVNDVET